MPKGAPLKQGLDYFFIDCDVEENPKVKQVIKVHPDKGWEVISRIWIRIYGRAGYFCEWGDTPIRRFAADCSTSVENLRSIINTCLVEQLFDEEMLNKYQILTSSELQSRYLYGSKTRTRLHIVKEFSLVSPDFNEEWKVDITKKAFYISYPDVSQIFDSSGFLVSSWKNKYTSKELIWSHPPFQDTIQETKQLIRQTFNSTIEPEQDPFVDPAAGGYNGPPMGTFNFDWEKSQVLSDTEWKHEVAHAYNVGSNKSGVFEPDFPRMDYLLGKFFIERVGKGDKKTAKLMKEHFFNWMRTSPVATGKSVTTSQGGSARDFAAGVQNDIGKFGR